MSIHKSHSKQELIDIINELDISNIELSHSDSKADTQNKILGYLSDYQSDTYGENVFKVRSSHELGIYLMNSNPKKNLSVKDKAIVMSICKEIGKYAKCNYIVENTRYATIQDLQDDMLYIAQYGDLPSVRRAVKLMNDNIQRTRLWTCVISPQMKKIIEEKEKQKKSCPYHATFKRGEFTLTFD
tara:strand:- start:958 stop:1512 length:555 start_codon:yes stop_codon:yes gene_type:complete